MEFMQKQKTKWRPLWFPRTGIGKHYYKHCCGTTHQMIVYGTPDSATTSDGRHIGVVHCIENEGAFWDVANVFSTNKPIE